MKHQIEELQDQLSNTVSDSQQTKDELAFVEK